MTGTSTPEKHRRCAALGGWTACTVFTAGFSFSTFPTRLASTISMCTDVHIPPNTLKFVRARGVPELELSSRECVRPLKLSMPASLVSYGSHNFWTPTHSDEGKCVGVCTWETSAEQHMPRHIGRVGAAYLHALTGSAPSRRDRCGDVEPVLSSWHSAPWKPSPGRCRLPGSRVRHHPPHASTRTCSHPLTDVPLPLRYRQVNPRKKKLPASQ